MGGMVPIFSNKIVHFVSSPRGAKITILFWALLILVLTATAPTAKQYAVNAGEGHIRDSNPSAVTKQLMEEHFPSSEGMAALLVFHSGDAIAGDEEAKLESFSEWLASDKKPSSIASAVPFHAMPAAARDQMISDDRSTVLLTVNFQEGLSSEGVMDALDEVQVYWDEHGSERLQLEMTGPAAIAADTLTLFRNADFVLMIATVLLILVLLIVIYRSPLLAVFPLIIAGMVYMAVDRIIGLSGESGLFDIDKQSLSIMMILLFAVITDYCLFVFSRYREALADHDSKYTAMRQAMTHVMEPILFSGGTVFIAMLALFASVFKPYHGFAPVFSIAVAVILFAGLTLIPALFALVGRRAFWPFMPKAGKRAARVGIPVWEKVGTFVTSKPKLTLLLLGLPLVLLSFNALSTHYSFNLMKSFPPDTPSRVGFELLEEQFPPGELAPVTVILQSDKPFQADASLEEKLGRLKEQLNAYGELDSIMPDPARLDVMGMDSLLSENKQILTFKAILKVNPYEKEALDLVERWQDDSGAILNESGFDSVRDSLHFGGQTAEQLDVRTMNQRDTIVIFTLIAIFITAILGLQTRSIRLPVYMMLTILLSYAATIGLTWFVFHSLLDYDSFSYRIPVYTFVFMVALGVDYNIMLVSRIKEEARKHPWRDAVRRGVTSTGGVISSAGIILAATFGVLITQPIQELFLFGFAMAAGIIIDTFLVRGMLLPALMTVGFKNRKMHESRVIPRGQDSMFR
ncbi:MMPL family transporter [Paenibacillus spongiae]|uniref:MMPL family transporter n=1 Tax=Paenibacillus spongiae TaxID=2909671 RepID=A0ABY5S9U6_9BACL|nr:MMPL family transporter [Paenibacillus spongiae]UVI29560.1 MMPL family transporter [Paenibacillus spongiae]